MLPESPNSYGCGFRWTMRHVRPASVLRNVSDSSYGASWAPIDPTPMTKPGAGDENIRPKLCGFVTE